MVNTICFALRVQINSKICLAFRTDDRSCSGNRPMFDRVIGITEMDHQSMAGLQLPWTKCLFVSAKGTQALSCWKCRAFLTEGVWFGKVAYEIGIIIKATPLTSWLAVWLCRGPSDSQAQKCFTNLPKGCMIPCSSSGWCETFLLYSSPLKAPNISHCRMPWNLPWKLKWLSLETAFSIAITSVKRVLKLNGLAIGSHYIHWWPDDSRVTLWFVNK